jgi:hypothetical protein
MAKYEVLSSFALNWTLALSTLMIILCVIKIVRLKYGKLQYSKLDLPPLWSLLAFFCLGLVESVYLCFL